MPSESARPAGRMSRGARRAQLLESARSVFVSQGFHATSMDDIAESAGVSKPVLYQHFSSKLALYQALLDESAAEMVRRVQLAIAASDDNAIRVEKAVAAYFGFVADEGQAFRLIFESDLRDEPVVAAIVDHAIELCISEISNTITADTGADDASARLLAAGLVGLSQVSARYWLNQSNPISRERAVSLLSSLAWRGISHFPRNQDLPPSAADIASAGAASL
ncbi:MAG: TetR/AcrR family transcriptional regulator [Nakamurella sp.]